MFTYSTPLIFVSVVSCTVPSDSNAVRNPDQGSIDYETSVTFTCNNGFAYQDGTMTKTRHCEATGQLSGVDEECAGIYCIITSYVVLY